MVCGLIVSLDIGVVKNFDGVFRETLLFADSVPSNQISDSYFVVKSSPGLEGEVAVSGAKNSVLVIMASLLLTSGKSTIKNVPLSDDVEQMIRLLRGLGAKVKVDLAKHTLEVDTSTVCRNVLLADTMKKMRASILLLSPLLLRFGEVEAAPPGGCVIGKRPINYHISGLVKMGAVAQERGDKIHVSAKQLKPQRLVLEYPSVGATENLLMAAVLVDGKTSIVNAAIEPEVLDLVDVLKKMGAKIEILPSATIEITGVKELNPVEHDVIPDRLEVGSFLAAAAITGGKISVPNARAYDLDLVLSKFREMGHKVIVEVGGIGVTLESTLSPKAVSFRTLPYPGFPTDLQAQMMVVQCLANGEGVIHENVHDNRLMHVHELCRMGANVKINCDKALVTGVSKLRGCSVTGTDLRATCALVLAGLGAVGTTFVSGVNYLTRGYEAFPEKLSSVGANIVLKTSG